MKSYYLPSLDGLRFVAFLLVLIHHLPPFTGSATIIRVHNYGWVGVELFFVISSYLFFHLLTAEYDKNGKISVSNFYLRRILRIYPLMIAFPLAMLLILGPNDAHGWQRFSGIALLADNMISWFALYNVSIPYCAHLWTLSYEAQVYIVVPAMFFGMISLGQRRFAVLLILIAAFCLALRVTVYSFKVPHPLIWVSPFLRPDSILVGAALAIYRPKWDWKFSVIGMAATGWAFLSTDMPWASSVGNLIEYPLAAAMCGFALDLALRSPAHVFLESRRMRHLGTISFGLYVFHNLVIAYTNRAFEWATGAAPNASIFSNYIAVFASALFGTTVLALISYSVFERPFLMLKRRVTAVEGRTPNYDVRVQLSEKAIPSPEAPQ